MRLGKDRQQGVAAPPIFSGRVKVTLVGLSQQSRAMSKPYGGLPAKVLVVEETTLDEVYEVVFKAIQEKCDDQSGK